MDIREGIQENGLGRRNTETVTLDDDIEYEEGISYTYLLTEEKITYSSLEENIIFLAGLEPQ